MKMFYKFLLVFHTLRYLKLSQIFFQVYYRFRKAFYTGEGKALKVPANTGGLQFKAYIPKPQSYANNAFTFLNLSKNYLSIKAINWDEDAYGKLWTYNLNYFDFLLQKNMDSKTGNTIVEDFISKYNTLLNAREPYPISLRGINWIKWLSHTQQQHIPKQKLVDECLWQQYQTLAKNIEYHLLGNHLLENAFSLLYGAFYFNDHKLYSTAKRILIQELNEQILPNGAHFELSPMYHQIMLDRTLDCINLIQQNQRFTSQQALLVFLESKASLMLGWLLQLTFSNGEIPMVNDSVNGIAPSTEDLIQYARRLNITASEIKLKDCGYRMYRHQSYELLTDYGIPGPDYIPGHAHADIFNFILNVKGRSVIVDTGISTYNTDAHRLQERSTSAHNTVKVNGKNQSQVWSSFRMAKRVKPTVIIDNNNHIMGYYTGLESYNHEREFVIEETGFIINDKLTGNVKEAVAFLHFHPAIIPEINDNIVNAGLCKIVFIGAETIQPERYLFAEGFNLRREAWKIRIDFKQQLNIKVNILNN